MRLGATTSSTSRTPPSRASAWPSTTKDVGRPTDIRCGTAEGGLRTSRTRQHRRRPGQPSRSR
eukprot:3468213-Alexandrium_andersonii.AAC.1